MGLKVCASFKFGCYGNLKFSSTYNGELEKTRHLLPNHCRYFDKTFIEFSLEKSSTTFMDHCLYWLPRKPKCKKGKWGKILKKYLLRNHLLYEAETS